MREESELGSGFDSGDREDFWWDDLTKSFTYRIRIRISQAGGLWFLGSGKAEHGSRWAFSR